MKINELIEFCESHGTGGDVSLRILSVGTLGGCAAIESASVGFDWNQGSVVLHARQPVILYGEQQQKDLADARRLKSMFDVVASKGGFIGHNATCPWCRQSKAKGHAESCRYAKVFSDEPAKEE